MLPLLIPDKYRATIVSVFGDFELAMRGYFRAQALVALIVGVLFAIGFSTIDLPMAVLLGLFIGLLNMVPYLQIIGFLPASFFGLMLSLETGQGFWTIMGLIFLVFAIVQLIQDAILVPRIMGGVTGLNPAIILLSLSIWGKVLGFLGLIIALPLTFMILSYYKRFMLTKTADLKQEAVQ